MRGRKDIPWWFVMRERGGVEVYKKPKERERERESRRFGFGGLGLGWVTQS